MGFLSPNLRVTLSLVCIAMSVFFLALACQLVPDYYAARLESRKSYCEHLALHCSLAMQKDDVDTLKEIVQASVRRHPDILSAGLRPGGLEHSTGDLLLEVGTHRPHWNLALAQEGSTDFLGVPILQSGRRWGTLELRFESFRPPGLWGMLQHPVVPFLVFFCGLCAVGFFFFMRVLFRQIDFSQARVVPKRVRATLNTLAEGVVILDKEGQIVMANDSFARAAGKSAQELQGSKFSELGWAPNATEGPMGTLPWDQSLQDKQAQTGTVLRLERDDQASILSVNSTPILGDDGSLRGALASFDNLTPLERKNSHLSRLLNKLRKSRSAIQRQNVHLHDLATKDPLTACLNRRAFFGEFETHWAALEKAGRPLCCLMVDIDHFKSINDNHGHSVGDQVLQQVSKLLREKIRKSDLVCRYGGEEFCVLMPGTELPEAIQLAERLRKEIETSRPARLTVTASLGVSDANLGAKSMQELLDQADKSLYVSKRSGRNRVTCWDNAVATAVVEKDKGRPDAKAASPQAAIPFQAVNVLLTTLAYRHPATAEHCRRVSDLCVLTASGVLSSADCYVLEMAALLHDVGKLGVPDSILLKPGPLTAEEWQKIKAHEAIGEDVVTAAFSSTQLTDIIRGHHFHFQSSPKKAGAPSGEELPAAARILAIADAYDSMISDQVYRKRRSQHEAFEELRANAGKQFDPDLVDLFIQRVAERGAPAA